MNTVPTLVVSFLMRRLEADDDTDEDDDDEDNDLTDDDEDDEDDVDDDEEEPETWQVGSTVRVRSNPNRVPARANPLRDV
jgi:hypothetical protein